MKLSIIIPVHNSSKTLRECLDSIYKVKMENVECIVIDDKSTDNSREIAKNFPCRLIALPEKKGAANARNIGANNSRGEILLFIDSDGALQDNSIKYLLDTFNENQEIIAVQGMYTERSKYSNIFNQYKDLYYYFYFKRIESTTTTVSTHCFAVKRSIFQKIGGFDNKIPRATIEDGELSYKINRNSIILNKQVLVRHLKEYTLKSLLRNDFNSSSDKIKSLLRNKTKAINNPINIANSKIDTISMILSIMLAPLIIIFLIVKFEISLIVMLIFFILNLPFFKLSRFNLKIIFIHYLCILILSIGGMYGFAEYITGKKY